MFIRCGLCGGDNTVNPGQEMLACSYCGSALAVEKEAGPEHLILAHTRDDGTAESVLRSHLIERNRRRPVVAAVEFSYVPYAMTETKAGETSTVPACSSGAPPGGVPYPPAGEYRFFDESNPPAETVIPADRDAAGAIRIVHLPVYRIRYGAGDWKGSAAVVGESWQTIAAALPPERPRALRLGLLAAAAALFAAYLFIGTFASSALARLALIMAASGCGCALFAIHERTTKHE